MKPEEPDHLLNAVLDDGPAFREAILRQTLALARTRRRNRFARRALAVCAILIGAIGWLLPPPTAPESKPVPASASTLRIIHTAPLASVEMVRPASTRVETINTTRGPIAVLKSRPDSIVRIATGTSAPIIRYLDDRQLLAAFPGEHPILIAPGTREARLVFR